MNLMRWGKVVLMGLVLMTPVVVSAAGWSVGKVSEITVGDGPVVAVTSEELAHLKAAYKGDGPEHDVVAGRVAKAREELNEAVVFPPRGGQHNQWYQCDKCQMGLETIDATHHKCPQCGAVYSGAPYDDVIYNREHLQNMRRALDSAWAWAITGEKRFARDAADILTGYANRYMKYEYHNPSLNSQGTSGGRILSQTLSEASMMAMTTGPAYDLIRDFGVLTEEENTHIRKDLILAILHAIDRHKAGKGNWQTWHNAAFVVGGASIGEASWVRHGISQPGNGFVSQMDESVTAEGMWYENSWGYHFYDLMGQVALVEGARRVGVDLWSHPRFKLMFTLPIQYVMPNGTLPRFADSTTVNLDRYGRLYEAAYAAYQDETFLRVLPEHPGWDSITYGRKASGSSDEMNSFLGSRVFPGAGHAILRTKGDAGLAAALTFSEFGGFHGHFDKLSFVLFGYGQELGYDPGRAKSQAYRLPIHGNWYRATAGHNTVVVDEKSQEPAAGKCIWSQTDNDEYVGVTAETTEAWPDMTHRRTFVLTPDYALVFDRLTGAKQDHRFDWIYHNTGMSVGSQAATETVSFATDEGGFVYIKNALQGNMNGPESVYIPGDGVTTKVTILAPAGSTLTVGDGPGESVLDRIPVCFATTRGKEAVFAAVIEPLKDASKSVVKSLSTEERGGKTAVTITRDSGMDTLVIAPDGVAKFERDGASRF